MKKQGKLKNSAQQVKKTRKKRILIGVLISIVVLPLLIAGIAIGGFVLWAKGVPLDKSLLPTAIDTPTFYDVHSQKIDYYDDTYIQPSSIPENLKNAFIALEDKRFYSHNGYDVIRMFGAFINNLKSGTIKEGASTITQQLVKNTHLSHERTLERKLKELAIAIKLEKEYEKDEILSMYLSVIYFGNGAYGVKSATKLYFDKQIEDLTLSECATLAGIVKNPKKFSPKEGNIDCMNRRNTVLNIMLNNGYITQNEYSNAVNEQLILADKDNRKIKKGCDLYISKAIDEVCNALNITKYQLKNSGMHVYTNLDMRIQSSLINQSVDMSNYENNTIESETIVLDNSSNAVIAYHSTLNYEVNRQAGSILKPIAVYAPAIDCNLVSLCTPIIDEKINFNGYSPRNFGDMYYGKTTVREGITKSLNSVALKLIDYLGVQKCVEYLNKFGINVNESEKNYSLALGGKSVKPLEIANAYRTIANNGVYSQLKFVKYAILNGVKLYAPLDVKVEYSTHSKDNIDLIKNNNSRAIKASTSSLIKNALIDTVNSGTAKTLSSLNYQVASKTGTSENINGSNSDAWSASFNNDFTVVVWHGNDIGMGEKGGGYPTRHALKIWQCIDDYYEMQQYINCQEGIVKLDVDAYTTNNNMQVTLASENTALEYRKSEIFASDNIPKIISNTFEEITDFNDFDIFYNYGKIDIVFDVKEIYSYRIYRKDVISNCLIYEIDGKNIDNNQLSIKDTPLEILDSAIYEVECYITCNPNACKKVSKQVFID